MRPDAKIIELLVRNIVASVHPLRVVLFGSAARGTMRPDSDLDVLVVMPNGTHRGLTARTIYLHLWEVPAPTDVVVVTETDLTSRVADSPGVIKRALEEGKILYDRAA